MRALLAAFTALALPAQAGLIVVSEVESGGQKQAMTMKIEGSQSRVDVNQQMSTIIDGASGDSVMLMHQQKRAMRIPGGSIRAMIDQSAKAAGNETPALKATGEKKTINGFKTERYSYLGGGTKVDFWIAADFPNAASVLKQLETFQESGISKFANTRNAPKMSDFPGVPIRTTTTSSGRSVVSTIKTIEERAIPASEFEVPKDYVEAEMPLMPGAVPSGVK